MAGRVTGAVYDGTQEDLVEMPISVSQGNCRYFTWSVHIQCMAPPTVAVLMVTDGTSTATHDTGCGELHVLGLFICL